MIIRLSCIINICSTQLLLIHLSSNGHLSRSPVWGSLLIIHSMERLLLAREGSTEVRADHFREEESSHVSLNCRDVSTTTRSLWLRDGLTPSHHGVPSAGRSNWTNFDDWWCSFAKWLPQIFRLDALSCLELLASNLIWWSWASMSRESRLEVLNAKRKYPKRNPMRPFPHKAKQNTLGLNFYCLRPGHALLQCVKGYKTHLVKISVFSVCKRLATAPHALQNIRGLLDSMGSGTLDAAGSPGEDISRSKMSLPGRLKRSSHKAWQSTRPNLCGLTLIILKIQAAASKAKQSRNHAKRKWRLWQELCTDYIILKGHNWDYNWEYNWDYRRHVPARVISSPAGVLLIQERAPFL